MGTRSTQVATSMRDWFLILALGVGVHVGTDVARGQSPETPPGTNGGALPDPAALPPQVRLGYRVDRTRASFTHASTVVIVRNGWSYLKAIGAWTPGVKFPVLLDDGTRDARENIARFVRAYKPRQVIAWDDAAAEAPADARSYRPTRGEIDVVLAMSAGFGPGETGKLGAYYARVQSPGLVISDLQDPAWTAAVALAAGRSQPLALVSVKGNVGDVMSASDASALCAEIERACEATGLSWREQGDEIEAVTLCLNAPARFDVGEKHVAALTDRVGRDSKEQTKRWAWSGEIIGNSSVASYRAMSAIFLIPSSAWCFDGYPDTKPWNTYDASEAAKILRERGLSVVVDDTPDQSLTTWRSRAAGMIDAGVILVNSKGNSDFFDLEPGTGKPGDVPFLKVPAIMHFVHSWSAQSPSNRNSVAGRWLERGAYAYAGSVEEPYLQGFVPTPMVARRLASGMPFGVAVRFDDGPVWKIATLGDPLVTLGPPIETREAPIALAGGTPLEEMLQIRVERREFFHVLRILTVMGRDADVQRLVASMIANKPEELTEDVAAEAVMPVFRAGDLKTLTGVYAKLKPNDAADGMHRDALWLKSFRADDARRPEDELLRLLRDNIRPEQAERDAAELASMWRSAHGKDDAVQMLQGVRDHAKVPSVRDGADAVLKKMGP
ncbi:MAG: hypothetical protein AB7Q00_02475 [Phycisphaerales bacterium]